MGTRGFLGFIVDGEEKIGYNHLDSYPAGLGLNILVWLKDTNLEEAKNLAKDLKVIDSNVPPTEDQKIKLARYANLNVGEQSLDDWYVLLRDTQGDPKKILEAGFMEDAHDFPEDSLFAEWGYIVDFDKNTFEVYEGFQTKPHTEGRFSNRGTQTHRHVGRNIYYPVKLVGSWALDSLPSNHTLDNLED